MGNVRRTAQNLEIIDIDTEKNLLLIKGAVPGHPGSDVIVKLAVKYKDQEINLNDPSQTEQNPAAEEAQTEQNPAAEAQTEQNPAAEEAQTEQNPAAEEAQTEQTPAEASAEVTQTEKQKVDDENKK